MLWRRREWRRLLNLIDHLPPNCFTNAALANDEEYAEAILEHQRESGVDFSEDKPAGPSAVYWSPEMGQMATLIDKVSTLIEVQSSKPKKVVPYPRPKTAFDEIRDAIMMDRKQKVHNYLVAQLIAKPNPEQ